MIGLILQMGKLRLREGMELAQGHTAAKHYSHHQNPGRCLQEQGLELETILSATGPLAATAAPEGFLQGHRWRRAGVWLHRQGVISFNTENICFGDSQTRFPTQSCHLLAVWQ